MVSPLGQGCFQGVGIDMIIGKLLWNASSREMANEEEIPGQQGQGTTCELAKKDPQANRQEMLSN